MTPPRPPLSAVLPPLVLGTATFNTQYVADPGRMPYAAIVARALELGVAAFDTSPYYGPSEELLGRALADAAAAGVVPGSALSLPSQRQGQQQQEQQQRRRPVRREDYILITKVGRLSSNAFDYSPAAVRASVHRSLSRLRTPYLDLVYAHDVEFVTPAEAVAAVRALRALRDEGKVRYVGVSGFPPRYLCEVAERVRAETGEPLDAVLSYGHCTVQNALLADEKLLRGRLRDAGGVGVVLNASMLNMGLLTTRGVDAGPQAAWHPSPPGLRRACAHAAAACQAAGERFEAVAIRYSLDEWARAGGAAAGMGTRPRLVGSGGPDGPDGPDETLPAVGPTVIGVTSVDELVETLREWWSVLDGLRTPAEGQDARAVEDRRRRSLQRRAEVKKLVEEKLWPALGEWRDYSWPSPPPGWVNEGPRRAESARL